MKKLADISKFESICGIQNQGAVSDMSVFNGAARVWGEGSNLMMDEDYYFTAPVGYFDDEIEDDPKYGWTQVVRYYDEDNPDDFEYEVVWVPSMWNFNDGISYNDMFFDDETEARRQAMDLADRLHKEWSSRDMERSVVGNARKRNRK